MSEPDDGFEYAEEYEIERRELEAEVARLREQIKDDALTPALAQQRAGREIDRLLAELEVLRGVLASPYVYAHDEEVIAKPDRP